MFDLDQTFRPIFSGSSNQIFMWDAFVYSFIQHLVFRHCVECKTYVVESVSNVFIDIQISMTCGVQQKTKRREGHKEDRREGAKMASKKEKDSNAKNDWIDHEVFLLMSRHSDWKNWKDSKIGKIHLPLNSVESVQDSHRIQLDWSHQVFFSLG